MVLRLFGKTRHVRRHNNKGFSLVELIVTIMIMAIISGGAITSVSVIYNASTERAAETLCSMMKLARQKAIALGDDTGSEKITVFLTISQDAENDYYANIYSLVQGAPSATLLKSEKLGNSHISISVGNIGEKNIAFADFTIPEKNDEGADYSDGDLCDLMNVTTSNATKNHMLTAKYTFRKTTGGLVEAGTSQSAHQYCDIYINGSELQHIIVVRETGRCYIKND